MKKLLPIIFVFVLSIAVFGQSAPTKSASIEQLKAKAKPLKKSRVYAIGYDKFTDKSIVSFAAETLTSGTHFLITESLLVLGAEFRFDGKTLNNSIDEFTIIVSGMGKTWQFSNSQHLYIVAGEARFDLGNGLGNSSVGSNVITGAKTYERLDFKIIRKDLETIANAKSVEIKIADRVFTLGDKSKQAFKNVITLGTLE